MVSTAVKTLPIQSTATLFTTTHYGYTMNWHKACYGTAISDYQSVEERKQILDGIMGKRVVAAAKKAGTYKLLSVPACRDTEELPGDSLSHAMRPAWVSYFRNAAAARESSGDDNDDSAISLKAEIPLGWAAARSNRSIYLTWQYT